MDIHHLKVFASVYKHRSFSRASGELSLTQPTISEHVKSLEEELQCRLFDRVGRRIIPTKGADLLYARVVDILERLKDIKTDMGLIHGEVRGRLTVGASSTPGAYVIPQFAAEFRKRYPEVSFQVTVKSSRKIADLVSGGELLLGVVSERVSHAMLEHLPLVEDELVLVARPGLLKKEQITFGDLLEVPFILNEEGSELHKSMEKHHSEKGISLKGLHVVAMLGSMDSVREAVKSGLGASMLSRFAVKEDLRAGSLKEITLRGFQMRRSFYVISHKKRTLPAQYRAFLDYLMDARPPLAGAEAGPGGAVHGF